MVKVLVCTLCLLLIAIAAWPQAPAPAPGTPPQDDSAAMRQEIEQLKQTLSVLEKRLEAQEKLQQQQQAQQQQQVQQQAQQQQQAESSTKEISAKVDELDNRVAKGEVKDSLDRLNFSGDYRFEAHTIVGNVPAHYDGMTLQNLVVRSMFSMPYIGGMPSSVDQINNAVNAHYAEYLN